jgi:uncharacterized phage protein gp47/JayE
MADLPTRLDLYALGRDYVTQRAKKIDPTIVDVEGSDANIVVGGQSIVGDAIVKQLGYSINKLLLDGAQDEDLDRYAFDRYGLFRKGASPAVGAIQITRPTFAAGAGTIPIGTKITTNSGIDYITTSIAALGATSLLTTCNVRAVQAGKITQVGKNTIRRFSKPGDLFDKTLGCNNAVATTGGEDAEDDETFRNRIRNFWNTARRGVLAAISFGALSVPGVVSAVAIEALTTGAQPARIVNLYIADSSGVANAQLAQLVASALDDYRAAGITVLINTSIPSIVNLVLLLSFQANVDTVTLSDNVRAAVVEFVNSLPVNGTLYISDLYSVLRRFVADGLVVNQGSVVAPAGDLVPDIGSTLRTTTANVTVTTP